MIFDNHRQSNTNNTFIKALHKTESVELRMLFGEVASSPVVLPVDEPQIDGGYPSYESEWVEVALTGNVPHV